jgi:fumarate reductase subunit D
MHAKGQDMGLDTQVTRTADVAAAGSAFFAGTAWFAEVEPVVTVLAGLVAIVAGSFAAWYHFERAIGMRRRNRKIRDT